MYGFNVKSILNLSIEAFMFLPFNDGRREKGVLGDLKGHSTLSVPVVLLHIP